MTRPSQRQRDQVRKFTEDSMNAEVRIRRGIRPTFDEDTGLVTGVAGEVVYEGKARIRQITGAGVLNLGEADIDTATTTISIPWGSPVPRRDDLAEVVDDSSADAEPTGQYFRVLDIESGGLFGEARRMHCVVFRESWQWERQ